MTLKLICNVGNKDHIYHTYGLYSDMKFCECGCGELINELDKWHNRPRRFIYGHQNRGSLNPQWIGGKVKTHSGYILIKTPGHSRAHVDGYVFEHILIMEKQLGRPIQQYEIVHHINGIKDDNRIENLRLMTMTEHQNHHHYTASFVDHSNTICDFCGDNRTKMNKHRDGIRKYPLWLYNNNNKPICYRCWQRSYYKKCHQ